MIDEFLRWRMSFQSDAQAAQSAHAEILTLHRENEMLRNQLDKSITYGTILTFVCVMLLLSLWVSVAAQADPIDQAAAQWDRNLGPEPGKDYLSEIRKDCQATIKAMSARPGASWHSEYGWAHPYQCAWAEPEDQDLMVNRPGKLLSGSTQAY